MFSFETLIVKMSLNNVLLFVLNVTFQVFLSSAISTLFPPLQYPESYRDHVYRGLSENGKDLFYAIKIHPDCGAKHGVCMRRAHCIEKEMLYLSRVCYLRDLVCCYDKYTKPLVATRSRPDNSTGYNEKVSENSADYNYTAVEDYNDAQDKDLLRYSAVNISYYNDMFNVDNSTNYNNTISNISSSLNFVKESNDTLTTLLVVVNNTS